MSGVERKPLTVEQLRGMFGKPVLLKSPWWTEWCIVRDHGEHEIAGDAISFTRRYYGEVCLSLADYGKTWAAYAYPPARIDREKWEPCEKCKYTPENACRKCQNEICNAEYRYPCTGCNDQSRFVAKRFCQNCGRPLTEEAWAELERRCLG